MSERLTDNQRDVMEGLYRCGDDWWRPMDFGGTDASHHSATAIRLCARGLVERTDRLAGSISGVRKTWRYRITDAGRQALKEPSA